MKLTRVITITVFVFLIILPTLTFNFQPNAISEIDNRSLTENPFSAEALSNGDLTKNLENYVNDRIGLRDKMILAYTVLNDQLFDKMVHPSYTYGKEGYVFGAGIWTNTSFADYHAAFADMVKQIQDYCDARSVPFLFVFNPAKPAVLTEYIADGIRYDRSWVDELFAALDARGVRYLDNTETLSKKTEEGESVFNRKYDANHWNDLGAYYGTNAMLEILKADIPEIHLAREDELTINHTLMQSLPVSQFPISEQVPSILIDMEYQSIRDQYQQGILLNTRYKGFGSFINPERQREGAPTALVFQGSYMNNFGSKYLINAFSEYTYVHDYQNVLNFPYYFNIFQPDCVIFEVAEYTLEDTYFDYEGMLNLHYNIPLETAQKNAANREYMPLSLDAITVEPLNAITKITWRTDRSAENVWLVLDTAYDMFPAEGGYSVSIPTEAYEKYSDTLKIYLLDQETLTAYSAS